MEEGSKVLDFVDSGKIGRVPDLGHFFTPSYNKHLAFPTASIVSAAISSKTEFLEWNAFKGGWVTYANDFPDSWSRCDLIVGSSGVPIKKGMVEAIGAATPIGKGKEKKIKQEAVKKSEVKGSVESTEVGYGTKRRKIALACKQLVIFEGPEDVDPSAIGKDISHPSILKIRVKTKVESSILQILVGSFKGTSFVAVTFST